MTKSWDPVQEGKDIVSPEVGKTLRGTKYLVVRKIGRGGMGEIFEVIKPPQIRGVLKRMAPEMAKFSQAKQLFLSEVQALAELDHPHIVRVYDFDSDGFGVPFFVMERLEGRTVGSLIDKRGRVEPEEAYEIVRQLLDALECAHTHSPPVVHRDIKPDNIFLHQPKHGEPILKLIDFGLATESGSQEKDFAGSVHYAAPEQMYGRPVTGSADLYAVGAVLYEMLSGRLPYDGPTPTEIGRMKQTREPAPLAKVAPWVPAGVAKLVHGALSPEPEGRPVSARAFREELDRAVLEGARSAGKVKAAIPAFTKVRAQVPLPASHERTEARDAVDAVPRVPVVREGSAISAGTLVNAGIPVTRNPLAGLGPTIAAGLLAGLALLGLLHLAVRPS